MILRHQDTDRVSALYALNALSIPRIISASFVVHSVATNSDTTNQRRFMRQKKPETDMQKIDRFIRKYGVILCPPRIAVNAPITINTAMPKHRPKKRGDI